jgi:hypothetical protein
MPTLYNAELTEPAPATVDIWKRMHDGLKPRAQEILSFLGYYAERDLPLPSASDQLTQEELRELDPIASALMRAAIGAEERFLCRFFFADFFFLSFGPSWRFKRLSAADFGTNALCGGCGLRVLRKLSKFRVSEAP